MYSKIKYKDITVSYLWRLNGGGVILADEYVRLVKEKIGKVKHISEYCAGPGYIGFALLAHGLCDYLTLCDVNPQAIAAIHDTIRNNRLEGRVKVYQSDALDMIPSTEKWDLVVGNPPWWLCDEQRPNIRVCDPFAQVHIKFFNHVHKFLNPGGSILFVEGGEYTNPTYFRDMVENNGLKIKTVFKPVSFLEIGKEWSQYPWLNALKILFLRLSLCLREVYFLWITPDPSFKPNSPLQGSLEKGRLLQIKRKRKTLSLFVLAMIMSLGFLFTPVGSFPLFVAWIGAFLTSLYLAMALKKKRPELYICGMLLPIVSLIIPLILIWQASLVLKDLRD